MVGIRDTDGACRLIWNYGLGELQLTGLVGHATRASHRRHRGPSIVLRCFPVLFSAPSAQLLSQQSDAGIALAPLTRFLTWSISPSRYYPRPSPYYPTPFLFSPPHPYTPIPIPLSIHYR